MPLTQPIADPFERLYQAAAQAEVDAANDALRTEAVAMVPAWGRDHRLAACELAADGRITLHFADPGSSSVTIADGALSPVWTAIRIDLASPSSALLTQARYALGQEGDLP